MQHLKDEGVGTCPVCNEVFAVSNLDAHCQTHFGASEDSDEPICTSDGNEERSGVLCPLGCGQHIAVSDLDSHEAAHRWRTASSLAHHHVKLCITVKSLFVVGSLRFDPCSYQDRQKIDHKA